MKFQRTLEDHVSGLGALEYFRLNEDFSNIGFRQQLYNFRRNHAESPFLLGLVKIIVDSLFS